MSLIGRFILMFTFQLTWSAAGLLPDAVTVRLIADDLDSLEGPAWSVEEQALYFSRQTNQGAIFLWSQVDGIQLFRSFPYKVNGNAFDREGRLINCESSQAADKASRRLVRYERDGSTTVLVDHLDGNVLNPPNDLVVDSKGRIWFTTPTWTASELAKQYILRHDPATGKTEQMAYLDKCNGIALSPDELTLYVVVWGSLGSSTHNKVVAYPITDEGLAQPQDRATGIHSGPDGMAVDRWGNLFVAVTTGTGKGVQVYGSDGAHLGSITLPADARDVTNVCFGGPRETTLFITAGPRLYAADLDASYYFGPIEKSDPENVHLSATGWLHLYGHTGWVYSWSLQIPLYLGQSSLTDSGVWAYLPE